AHAGRRGRRTHRARSVGHRAGCIADRLGCGTPRLRHDGAKPYDRTAPEVAVNRRTLDILVPFTYVIAILIAVYVGNAEWVGVVAVVGALLVGAYYAAPRQSAKKPDPTS